jgi:rhodanese-related sulfurtransferase
MNLNFKPLMVAALAVIAFSGPALAEEKPDSPATVAGAETINTAKAKELFDQEVLFVDVRKDSDWDAGRIPGAVHLDVNSALSDEALSEEIDKTDGVIFYCNGIKCQRSAKAAEEAVGWGYEHVYYYREGYPAWKNAGYPTE